MTKEQFDEQVLLLEEPLYNIACSMLSSPYDRADAVQESIKKAMIKRETLRNPHAFRPWLTRILVNECRNIQRGKNRVQPREAVEIPRPAAPSHDLRDALERLEEKQRLPIVLHHLAGYTTREVAAILKIPESTVKYRIVRGRERLKTILEEA